MIQSGIMTTAAALAVGAWLFLLVCRGGFWRSHPRVSFETVQDARRQNLPSVVAVVPARDEAAVIATCVETLLAQDYRGDFHVIVVDDSSEDGTANVARAAAAARGAVDRLEIVRAEPLPPDWTGKMWAVAQGIRRAERHAPEYLWLTDADIAHHPRELAHLIAKAEGEERDLVSLMVYLNCETFWERLLIPAFVFFFQMLYPFHWVNDSRRRIAAAAGGSMLVRRTALEAAGSIEAIRDAVIDDCALARLIKRRGAIWLGLTEATWSLRRYESLKEIWAMVARSAYDQLGYSRRMLALTVIGLTIIFIAPVVAFVHGLLIGNMDEGGLALIAWCLMGAAYIPTRRLYGRSGASAFALPVAALLYCAMTIDSARRHYRGRGGAWKGRTYGPAEESAG